MSAANGAAASRSTRIEQAEALLCSLAGIVAARILNGPKGELEEIHIVATDEVTTRQVVRNVQSALLAQLGILVDHRLISVAPSATANGNGSHREDRDPEPEPPRPETLADALTHRRPLPLGHSAADAVERPRPRLESMELERIYPHRIRCRLGIRVADELVTGEAETLDAPGASLEVAARAVLDAWNEAEVIEAGPFELEEIRIVAMAGRDYVVAAVRAFAPRGTRYLGGAAAVDELPEDAAAIATIQATEPWLGTRTRTHHIPAGR